MNFRRQRSMEKGRVSSMIQSIMIQQIVRLQWFLRISIVLLAPSLLSGGMFGADLPRKPFTVRDSIALTKLLDFTTPDGEQAAALFSPDHSHVVSLTRRGDLERNVNVETLQMFDVHEILTDLLSSKVEPEPRSEEHTSELS